MNMKVRADYTTEGVTFTCFTGEGWTDENKTILGSRTFTPEGIPEVLKDATGEKSLLVYGLSQVLQDRGNSVRKDGMDAFFARMDETITMLKAGDWKTYKEGAAAPAGGRWLAPAIAKVKGIPEEDVRAKLATMETADKLALSRVPAIKKAIMELQLAAMDESGAGEEAFDF